MPPCWPLVPYLPHPSLPPLLIRWILSRSSLVMTITPGNKKPSQTQQETDTQENSWHKTPTVAPHGSMASVRRAMRADGACDASATASAATARPRPTTARTKIPPSDDLQRKMTARQPDLHLWMRPRRRTERRKDRNDDRTERESTERTTETPGQSDDPNLIDHVV